MTEKVDRLRAVTTAATNPAAVDLGESAIDKTQAQAARSKSSESSLLDTVGKDSSPASVAPSTPSTSPESEKEKALRTRSTTKKFTELLTTGRSPQELSALLSKVPTNELAELVDASRTALLDGAVKREEKAAPPPAGSVTVGNIVIENPTGNPAYRDARGEARKSAEEALESNKRSPEFVELLALTRLAENVARERGRALADAERKPETIEKLTHELDAITERVRTLTAGDEVKIDLVRAQAQRAENTERMEAVSRRAYELARDAGAHESRRLGTASAEKLERYLMLQEDLLAQHPSAKRELNTHIDLGKKEGRKTQEEMATVAAQLNRDLSSWTYVRDQKLLDPFRTLTSYQVQVLRDCYDERYCADPTKEHLGNKLTDRISSSARTEMMRLYANGNGATPKAPAVDTTKLGSSFAPVNEAVALATAIKGTPAERAAIAVHNAKVIGSEPMLGAIAALKSSPDINATQVAFHRLYGAPIAEILRPDGHGGESRRSEAHQARDLSNSLGFSTVEKILKGEGSEAIAEGMVNAMHASNRARALQLGALEGSERPDLVVTAQLRFQYEDLLAVSERLLPHYPPLRQSLASEFQVEREQAFLGATEKTAAKLAKLVAIESSCADNLARSRAERRLEDFRAAVTERATQRGVKHGQNGERSLAARVNRLVELAVERGKAEGLKFAAEADGAAERYKNALSSLLKGTDENQAFTALESRSPELRALMARKFLERTKGAETIHQATEGDFSGLELEKASGLLSGNRAAAAAATIQMEMGALLGPDKDVMRKAERALTPDEGAEVLSRIAKRQGVSAETALLMTVGFEEMKIQESLLHGRAHEADARILHGFRNSSLLGNPEPEKMARHLETMRTSDGYIDQERIAEVKRAHQEVYKLSLDATTATLTDEKGRGLVQAYLDPATDPRSQEIALRSAQIAYGMESGVFSGNREWVELALSAPEDLRRRADEEEREEGALKAETANELDNWKKLNAEVIASYNKTNPLNGVDAARCYNYYHNTMQSVEPTAYQNPFEYRLKSTFSSHNAKVLSTIAKEGRLNSGQQIWDQTNGIGTIGSPGEVIRGATKRGIAAINKQYSDYAGTTETAVQALCDDLRGSARFDAEEWGLGRPETGKEALAAAQRRVEFERSGWIFGDNAGTRAAHSSPPAWVALSVIRKLESEASTEMREDLKKLEAAVKEGDELRALALFNNFSNTADSYRYTRDEVTNTVATTGELAIIGGTVFFTAGAATPMIAAAAAGGAFKMGVKHAVRGGGYGADEAGVDLAYTAANTAPGMVLAGARNLNLNAGSRVVNSVVGRNALRNNLVVGRNGTEPALESAAQFAAQSSRTGRVIGNSIDGAVVGVATTPIYGALETTMDADSLRGGPDTFVRNWIDNSLHALPYNAAFGAGFGAVGGLRAPKEFRLSAPLKAETALQKTTSPEFTPEAQAMLQARLAARGTLSENDLAAAALHSKNLSEGQTKALLEQMKESGQYTPEQIRVAEEHVKAGKRFTKYDKAELKGSLPEDLVYLSRTELKTQLEVAKADVERLGQQIKKSTESGKVDPALEAQLKTSEARLNSLTAAQKRLEQGLSRFKTAAGESSTTGTVVGAGDDLQPDADAIEIMDAVYADPDAALAKADAEIAAAKGKKKGVESPPSRSDVKRRDGRERSSARESKPAKTEAQEAPPESRPPTPDELLIKAEQETINNLREMERIADALVQSGKLSPENRAIGGREVEAKIAESQEKIAAAERRLASEKMQESNRAQNEARAAEVRAQAEAAIKAKDRMAAEQSAARANESSGSAEHNKARADKIAEEAKRGEASRREDEIARRLRAEQVRGALGGSDPRPSAPVRRGGSPGGLPSNSGGGGGQVRPTTPAGSGGTRTDVGVQNNLVGSAQLERGLTPDARLQMKPNNPTNRRGVTYADPTPSVIILPEIAPVAVANSAPVKPTEPTSGSAIKRSTESSSKPTHQASHSAQPQPQTQAKTQPAPSATGAQSATSAAPAVDAPPVPVQPKQPKITEAPKVEPAQMPAPRPSLVTAPAPQARVNGVHLGVPVGGVSPIIDPANDPNNESASSPDRARKRRRVPFQDPAVAHEEATQQRKKNRSRHFSFASGDGDPTEEEQKKRRFPDGDLRRRVLDIPGVIAAYESKRRWVELTDQNVEINGTTTHNDGEAQDWGRSYDDHKRLRTEVTG